MIEGPRGARPEELEALIDLANKVFYPDGSGNMGGWFPTLFRPENLDNLRIFLDHGSPVSLAGFTISDVFILGTRLRVASLGSVCTLPSHAGRGLASALVEEAVARAVERGAQVMLVSGGRGLYRRMGFVDAGLGATWRIDRGARLPDAAYEVREWREDDIPAMFALHQGERIRFIRDTEEFGALLRTRTVFCRPSRTWVAISKGTMRAYLCAQEPTEHGEARMVRIREMAGSRFAALSALKTLLQIYGADQVSLETPAADLEMESLAHAYGFPAGPHESGRTVKILDREGFFTALREHIQGRLDGAERSRLQVVPGPTVVFRLGREQLRLATDPDLTAFVFGSAEHRAPIPVSGKLPGLLARLFPLPLVEYGLNYI